MASVLRRIMNQGRRAQRRTEAAQLTHSVVVAKRAWQSVSGKLLCQTSRKVGILPRTRSQLQWISGANTIATHPSRTALRHTATAVAQEHNGRVSPARRHRIGSAQMSPFARQDSVNPRHRHPTATVLALLVRLVGSSHCGGSVTVMPGQSARLGSSCRRGLRQPPIAIVAGLRRARAMSGRLLRQQPPVIASADS